MIINVSENKVNNQKDEKNFILIAALFIHAAKIDESYTEKEKTIILNALSEISNKNKDELKIIVEKAEKIESESNQVLEFTREVKVLEKSFRLKIIEILWKIIYSDGVSDMYESNLMRRLSGLLYLTSKEAGDIKKALLNKVSNINT